MVRSLAKIYEIHFFVTNGRAWCPSRHGLEHPSCPPAVSQGKARKRNTRKYMLLARATGRSTPGYASYQGKGHEKSMSSPEEASWKSEPKPNQYSSQPRAGGARLASGPSGRTIQKILRKYSATSGNLKVCVRKQIQAEAAQKVPAKFREKFGEKSSIC